MSEENNSIVSQVARAQNQYNVLQMRLDTSQLIEQIRLFLNAEIEIVTQDNNTGEYNRAVIPIGIPKANKRGVSEILSWISMVINTQTVQGNFPRTMEGKSPSYDMYIYWFQLNLMDHLMTNLYHYDIEEDELPGIVDSIMNLVLPFMSRLIGNEERKSYSESLSETRVEKLSDSRKLPGLTK